MSAEASTHRARSREITSRLQSRNQADPGAGDEEVPRRDRAFPRRRAEARHRRARRRLAGAYRWSSPRNARRPAAVQAAAARARARGGNVIEASEKVLSAITRRDNPQMAVGVFSQHWLTARCDPAKGRGICGSRSTGCATPAISAPSCAPPTRSAPGGVILVGETTDPFSLETVRATMGSIFHVPLARMTQGRVSRLAQELAWPRWSARI